MKYLILMLAAGSALANGFDTRFMGRIDSFTMQSYIVTANATVGECVGIRLSAPSDKVAKDMLSVKSVREMGMVLCAAIPNGVCEKPCIPVSVEVRK